MLQGAALGTGVALNSCAAASGQCSMKSRAGFWWQHQEPAHLCPSLLWARHQESKLLRYHCDSCGGSRPWINFYDSVVMLSQQQGWVPGDRRMTAVLGGGGAAGLCVMWMSTLDAVLCASSTLIHVLSLSHFTPTAQERLAYPRLLCTLCLCTTGCFGSLQGRLVSQNFWHS